MFDTPPSSAFYEESPMIVVQVVPNGEMDIYRLLRHKVIHEAATWYWHNKKKTRLKHVRGEGYIEVGSADGVLVARVYPSAPSDLFYLAEKFMGRLVAWFEEHMAAINIQFVPDPKKRRKRTRRR
jgi:hypothetical protein